MLLSRARLHSFFPVVSFGLTWALSAAPVSAEVATAPVGLSAQDSAQIRHLMEVERYRVIKADPTSVGHRDPTWVAEVHQQEMRAYFSVSGSTVVPCDDGQAWRLDIRLVEWGSADRLRPAAAVQPRVKNNRIEYRRDKLAEWYVNDSRGLEHGFTIEEPPEDDSVSLLQFRVAFDGTLRPSLESNQRGVSFTNNAGEVVLRYGGLQAWDSNGTTLDASLSVADQIVEITVQTADAVFPITVDPLLTHVAYLIPQPDPWPKEDAWFGYSVAVDGSTAAIGAPDDLTKGNVYVFVRSAGSWIHQVDLAALHVGDVGAQFGAAVAVDGDWLVVGAPGTDTGTAYLFFRVDTVWSEVGVLTAGDAATGDEFGTSVAIRGNTIVVGAPGDDHDGLADAGAAYVFRFTGVAWEQEEKLLAADIAAGDGFGGSVDVSSDTVIVGAKYHDHVVGNAGAAYVFLRSGTSWSQQAELLAGDRAFNDYFGTSVALDNETAVIGAEWDDNVFSNAGSAYVFVRSGSVWSEQAKLVASDAGLTDRFGISVAVDGDTAVVGSHYDNHTGLGDPGSAYVFVRSGTVWGEQSKIVSATPGSGARLGISVGISGDIVFSGASRADLDGVTDAGSVSVFTRSGVVWGEEQVLVATDGARSDHFGCAVSMSGDTAVIGAFFDRLGGVQTGSASVYVQSGDSWTFEQRLVGSDAESNDQLGNVLAVDGDTAIIGSYLHNDGTGAVWVFVRSGSTWTEQAKLVASDGAAGDHFGTSLSISSETAAVGAGNANAVYVFVRSGSLWTEQQKVVPGNPTHSGFGWSVGIDGDTLAVGANTGLGNPGVVDVFTRLAHIWTEQQTLNASGPPEVDFFGKEVAVDGDTIAVGAPYADVGGLMSAGATYVFVQSGSTWTEQQIISRDSPNAQDQFGSSLDLDGERLAVGFNSSTHAGVELYQRVGSSWSKYAEVVSGGGTGLGEAVALEDRWLAAGESNDDPISGSNNGNEGSVSVFRPTEADLGITKDDGQATAVPGQPVTYTIVASNPAGLDDAFGATVTDLFPPELTGCAWTCSPAGGGFCTPNGTGNIIETVDLPVGGSVTYTASCTIGSGATGTLSNTATVGPSADIIDPALANNSATDVDTLTVEADLLVSKTNHRDEIVETHPCVYEITASNSGPAPVSGATVSDSFPPELSDCVWTCTASGGATCTASGSGALNDVIDLPVGGTATYTAACIVAASSGSCSNTATVAAPTGVVDPVPTNNAATDVDVITPLTDWIFGDGFETGDTTVWSNSAP